MSYTIAKPCVGVKDTACVAVCPVDVIHPTREEPDLAAVDQLFIDPVNCIGCGLCVDECPVRAIFRIDEVPPEWSEFIEKNAAHFK